MIPTITLDEFAVAMAEANAATSLSIQELAKAMGSLQWAYPPNDFWSPAPPEPATPAPRPPVTTANRRAIHLEEAIP